MHYSHRSRIRYMTTAAAFAAIIFVTTYFLHINIPFSAGGYIHPGDTFIYLAACLLPTPYAAAAAAIGAAFSDAIAAPIYIPATIVIKAVLTLFFRSSGDRFVNRRNVIALFLAGLTGVAGYFLWETILFGIRTAAINVPLGLVQPVASGILFVIIGAGLDKAGVRRSLRIE